MEESKFCTGCGKTLEPGMQFCPQCGLVVSGSATEAEFKEQQKEFTEAVRFARRNWLIFLLAIYAIPVIVFSLYTLLDSSNIADSVWASDEFQKWITSHGYNYTLDDIKNYITYAAGLALASGLCATVSLVMIILRKYWIIAVIACFIAAFLCFWSIFGIIIGILVAWMIMGAKDIFEDQPAESE